MSWDTLAVLGLVILVARCHQTSPWKLVYVLFMLVCALQVGAWDDRQMYYANWRRDWMTDSARWARDLQGQVEGTQANQQSLRKQVDELEARLHALCNHLPAFCAWDAPVK